MRVIECQQGSPEWFKARRGVATASEFHRIITPTQGKAAAAQHGYACELIAELIDPNYGQMDPYCSAAMRNGLIGEAEARRWYEADAGESVEQVGFIMADDGRWGCSPDGLVGTDGGLELKSPEPKTHVEYLYTASKVGPEWMPPKYLPQVHGALVITGRKYWEFCSYVRGLPPLRVRVVPNDFTEQLRECLEQFWAIYSDVRARVPVTPIEIAFPDPEPPVSEEDMQAAMFVPLEPANTRRARARADR